MDNTDTAIVPGTGIGAGLLILIVIWSITAVLTAILFIWNKSR